MEVDRLRALPLFGELDHHDLSVVATWVHEIHLDAGQALVEQGAIPRDLVVIEQGTVEVIRDGERLATLGPGDVVGEMGLLMQQRAMATVRAVERVVAIGLAPERLDEMSERMPELTDRLWAMAAERDEANEG